MNVTEIFMIRKNFDIICRKGSIEMSLIYKGLINKLFK